MKINVHQLLEDCRTWNDDRFDDLSLLLYEQDTMVTFLLAWGHLGFSMRFLPENIETDMDPEEYENLTQEEQWRLLWWPVVSNPTSMHLMLKRATILSGLGAKSFKAGMHHIRRAFETAVECRYIYPDCSVVSTVMLNATQAKNIILGDRNALFGAIQRQQFKLKNKVRQLERENRDLQAEVKDLRQRLGGDEVA